MGAEDATVHQLGKQMQYRNTLTDYVEMTSVVAPESHTTGYSTSAGKVVMDTATQTGLLTISTIASSERRTRTWNMIIDSSVLTGLRSALVRLAYRRPLGKTGKWRALATEQTKRQEKT